jgi:hypothetical protein
VASGHGSLDRDVYNSNYNLLFRWFVGLSADDPVWDATVFCKNRDRLLNGDIARKFFFFPEAVRATVADWSNEYCPARTGRPHSGRYRRTSVSR